MPICGLLCSLRLRILSVLSSLHSVPKFLRLRVIPILALTYLHFLPVDISRPAGRPDAKKHEPSPKHSPPPLPTDKLPLARRSHSPLYSPPPLVTVSPLAVLEPFLARRDLFLGPSPLRPSHYSRRQTWRELRATRECSAIPASDLEVVGPVEGRSLTTPPARPRLK
ncbi:hypothetical protein CABS01_00857 [Colletotrichum abscissum]|uniref:Uncharacterized protein n=1 Tax=Colletotrichum abscissum TaxID=1671311 RepID=A0A9Q0B6A1_9PEZI|nr:uncharacterized protein CABS01_00857 [Colletotrichum abscissum]KAI3556730.1 hypothetical protein CABS02_03171 [Colletotrichum abscissum]KAK1505389.1 hypothetical protein CABS01_00857 [Colletotrichum abscissum]